MSGFGFILIILAFVFLYFVLVRPQKRRQLEQQRMLSDLKVGDEVVTAGGIYGEVTGIEEDDELRVRIAPELEVKVARRAIGAVVPREIDEEIDKGIFEEPEEPDRAEPTPGT
jgi:preprotein translocase subunit YajC